MTKFDKRWLVDQITSLRAQGWSKADIAAKLKVSPSHVGLMIRTFGIPLDKSHRPKICPHCGLDTKSHHI